MLLRAILYRSKSSNQTRSRLRIGTGRRRAPITAATARGTETTTEREPKVKLSYLSTCRRGSNTIEPSATSAIRAEERRASTCSDADHAMDLAQVGATAGRDVGSADPG